MNEKIPSLGKMFQSRVLSLSMEFYLCLWNSIFVYGVLPLSMEFYLCLWSSIFVYVLSLSMARLGAKYAEVGCKVYAFWVHLLYG